MIEEIISPLLSTEWGRRSGLIAIALFSLLLLITLIQVPFTWHSDYVLAQNQLVSKKIQPLSNQSLALIKQIPNHHLFGASTALFPITSLQLNLIGVIQAEPASASRAIISKAGQPGKSYQAGDSLAPDVYIKAITSDGVILENGGHMEKLPLPRRPLLFQGMPKNLLPGD